MNKFKGLLGRTKSLSMRGGSRGDAANHQFDNAPLDSPEANVQQAIRLFCESGSNNNGGEEVLHLPVIVESAESSPAAAANAALQIKKFLGKEWSPKPYVQYNAIMLIRILSDNPGPRFTRNFDKSFVNTVKEMLRNCRDQSTQQILRETLDHLENDKAYDEGLHGLFQMWRKEKGQAASFSVGGQRAAFMGQDGYQAPAHGYERSGASGRRNRQSGLPSAVELASRIEEAKNTAKILLQLVQSTPTEDFVNNELIKEFSERCQSAQKSMQTYINATEPAPDHDTMATLIETNEQLSLATSRYQRALLAARRAMGVSTSPEQSTQSGTENLASAFTPPPGPPPGQQQQSNSAFAAPLTSQANTYDTGNYQAYGGYQPPSGPPPSGAFAGQQAAPPQMPPRPQEAANPFADPAPSQHSAFPPASQHHPQTVSFDDFDRQQQQQSSNHVRSFTIEKEPEGFAPPKRNNTNELENAYSVEQPKVSPLHPPEGHAVSPSSPPRPALGPYHNTEITQSYVGRQQSATNGLSMHGAGGAYTPNEQPGGQDVSPIETRR
ncbi:hypothetical protein CKM354_000966500 [Cercospora kikuchii]|uniref:GAT domain-containing protein n=1 Tax=Cercospora kikuchii TaxID=84275 RepID=A0A9P3CNQ4_9PEZI|nr:uncharacterized protein CKM354_000966500 [Cercospora kikuchii]GIZ46542.1 hypothetical protein CKM354_000966500 [Cercospora kikuchii]